MRDRAKTIMVGLVAALCILAVQASGASAAGGAPAWQIALTPLPTNFSPGSTGTENAPPMFLLAATNVGGGATSGTVTLEATLPAGLTPLGPPIGPTGYTFPFAPGPINPSCLIVSQTVTCTVSEPTYPARWVGARIPVAVSGSLTEGKVLAATASVSGGGAQEVTTAYETEISSDVPDFGFLPGEAGIDSLFLDGDGSAETEAGGHPDQLTVSLAFPIGEPTPGVPTGAGHPRTVISELPGGLVGSPAATARRCTEAEFISTDCPAASQVGVITAMTTETFPFLIPTPLYNMVPPPGAPAELAFNALNADIFVHLDAAVRSDGDYGVSVRADDVLARTTNPIMTAQVQTWGDPSGEDHDEIRGVCRFGRADEPAFCPVDEQHRAFLTMPSHCSPEPLMTGAAVASWEEPDVFHGRESPSTDILGNPVGIEGCDAEAFEPSLTAKPTTNLTDSASGLDVDLHQTQDLRLEHIAPANLRDATVTFPAGLAVNPAQADG